MALFGKKKEVVKAEPTCCCGGTEEVKAESTPCCGEKIDGVCCIKVLGAGCKSCHEQYENAKKAVENKESPAGCSRKARVLRVQLFFILFC